METYIESFIQAVEKRKKEAKIEGLLSLNGNNINTSDLLPSSIDKFYQTIHSLVISHPREIEILPYESLQYINNRFLWFSTINSSVKICFDTLTLNEANEWNIVNPENNFLITKTLSSYITNKIWAWVDRGRIIWEHERY